MKKLFTVFILSIIGFDVWSQGKLKTTCKVGLKIGSGLHTITGCPVKTKPRIAFMGGVWVQLKIGKSWTMQSELTRSDKGTGGDHQDQPRYGDYRLELSYYEIPILFQYHKKKAYFEFGPALAALINHGEYSKGGTFLYPTDVYPFSNKDFTFNLGTGYLLNEKWFIGLRLSHSLLPVRKQLPELQPIYNRGLVLAISRQIILKSSKNKQEESLE